MKIQLREKNLSLQEYLSKELGISSKEAKVINIVLRSYLQEKKSLKELDMNKLKKNVVAGSIALASLLFPNSQDASSDYFEMIKYQPNTLDNKTRELSIEQKIAVYQDALKHMDRFNPNKQQIESILNQLESQVKNKKLSKGAITKETRNRIKPRDKQQLEEVSWKNVKDFGKKTLASALLISTSFLPIAQSLYGNDSCSIDSSGEVVSCDASKLQSKRSVKSILSTVNLGMDLIKKNLSDSTYEYHEFTGDEIEAVNIMLDKLEKRKLTPEEKTAISNVRKETKQLMLQLKRVLRK